MIRQFSITNNLGQTYSLMNADDGALFNPSGLGYDDVTEYEKDPVYIDWLLKKNGEDGIL